MDNIIGSHDGSKLSRESLLTVPPYYQTDILYECFREKQPGDRQFNENNPRQTRQNSTGGIIALVHYVFKIQTGTIYYKLKEAIPNADAVAMLKQNTGPMVDVTERWG